MSIFKIIGFISIVILLFIGIDTIIIFKKSEGKLIEDIKKTLLIRIDIIMALTIMIAIITIINVLINKS